MKKLAINILVLLLIPMFMVCTVFALIFCAVLSFIEDKYGTHYVNELWAVKIIDMIIQRR